ncbi:hypothetical protein BOTCAL_0287g00120 [Botryotinia calthae]|uniref:Uncharacterized protein n=1 Tax=Botryotinia calthae TaxID=38488 RepID=A0A4Y8CUY8_9HELO|nr:hypothetical protein BOTCAL_0287g00120 [Botryotinia calthae]
MVDHSNPLPIRVKKIQSVVQNGLYKELVDLRPTADVQKTFNGADSPKPYSLHSRIESAAPFDDDAPQNQLQLRHSAGRTITNPDKLDMSATGSIDSHSAPNKKPNGRVLFCDILGPDGTPWMPKLGRCQRKKLRARLESKVREQRVVDEQRVAEKDRNDLEMKDTL